MPASNRSSELKVDTPEGLARWTVRTPAAGPVLGTLALGHGAGGGIGAADLQAVTRAAVAAGWRVALLEQPWRVAGRRVAVAPPRLDSGWTAALAGLPGTPTGPRSRGRGSGGPLIVGGRSAGARVACRTAAETGAAGVVCLAFPLHPPGRPERSRAPELELVDLPLLVVQGTSDSFGRPEEVAAVVGGEKVRAVAGDHGKPARPAEVGALVVEWLAALAGPQA